MMLIETSMKPERTWLIRAEVEHEHAEPCNDYPDKFDITRLVAVCSETHAEVELTPDELDTAEEAVRDKAAQFIANPERLEA